MKQQSGWLGSALLGGVLGASILLAAGFARLDSQPRNRAAETVPLEAAKSRGLRIREPAVAGLFYPLDRAELSRTIDEYLAAAPAGTTGQLRALICPHAGYRYSGATAAWGYKLAQGRDFQTVFLLSPSHYAAFEGAFIPSANAYRTPLGLVELSPVLKELAKLPPFVSEPKGRVQRPAWQRESPKAAPPQGEDTPDTWEHATEVQVPFLQRVLPRFQLAPVIFGEVSPEAVAKTLANYLDGPALVVASTDLSHYHPAGEAKSLDQRCLKAILDLDVEQMAAQEACGQGPVLALLHLARLRHWQPVLLQYRHSGEVSGDGHSVVGYAAIAFFSQETPAYSADDQKRLLDLARKTLVEVAAGGSLKEPALESIPARLREPKGCFVTLTSRGELRGCIGHILPQQPLYLAIMENTRNAALRDPRFPPVKAGEAGGLRIEISVLTEPKPLAFITPEDLLAKLRPGVDGVLLQIGGRGATYLPQVWSQIPDKTGFLDSLSLKAGCEAGAWRQPGVRVQTYQAEAFHEPAQP